MRPNPKPQEMYRHFKGNIYQIRCLAKHSETGEMMVVYQAMYGTFEIYVRPLSMFMEEVDAIKYPDVRQKYRFELIQEIESAPVPQTAKTEDEPTQGLTRSLLRKASGRAGQAEAETNKEKHTQPDIEVIAKSTAAEALTAEIDEQLNIDPLVMEFLEADTYEERLNILAALRHRITDEMINTMAVAVDLEIKEGDVEERYEELKNCLLTFEKYECNRLR